MSMLPNAVSSLSVAEKFELLDALWEDLEGQEATLNGEQTAELDRRMAAYEQNPTSVIPWEKLRAGLIQQ